MFIKIRQLNICLLFCWRLCLDMDMVHGWEKTLEPPSTKDALGKVWSELSQNGKEDVLVYPLC